MDVHADEAGLRPDPSATAMFGRPVMGGRQQQLFADAYPTYADTDKVPAVGRQPRGNGPARSRSSRALGVAVVVVALAVLAGGAALGLVQTGVIGNQNGTASESSQPPPAHHAAVAPSTPLVTPISAGAGTASYRVDIAAYEVTVTASTGRSWVSIGIIGQHPVFAGILAPGASQKEILLGSSAIEIGAGGTRLIVASGHRSVTLTPSSAPFSYQLLTKA